LITHSTVLKVKLLWRQVMEVQAEYFPPMEDIMLQNEAAADIYIIVSGVAVRFFLISDYVLKTYLYRFVQQANYTFLVSLSVEFDNNSKW
jgi:CRP-like cAMP-binding protein